MSTELGQLHSTPGVTRAPRPSGIRATRPASGRLASRACRLSRCAPGLATSVPCGPSSPAVGSRGSRRRGTDASAARRSGGRTRSTCTAARRRPCRLRRPRRRSGASVCAFAHRQNRRLPVAASTRRATSSSDRSSPDRIDLLQRRVRAPEGRQALAADRKRRAVESSPDEGNLAGKS